MSSSLERDSQSSRRAGGHFDSLGSIACVLLLLIVIGFAAFRFAPVLPVGSSRNVDKAFFSSVNLITLTGFTQSFAAVSEYPPAGRWLLALGSLASAATILVGGGMFLASVFGIRISTVRLLIYSIVLLGAGAACGFSAGLSEGSSAASGLGLFAVRSPDKWMRTLLVSLSIPATIGPVFLTALIGLHKPTRRRSLFNGCWIAVVAFYLLGLLLLFACGFSSLDASLASWDARSLGSGFFAPTDGNSMTQWIMAGLMPLGSAPAGVCGGIGVLPIVVLIQAGWSGLRGRRVDPLMGVAVSWLAIFAIALWALIVALALTQPQLPGDRMLFLAISALCNVGMSHDPIGMSREGIYILSTGMALGRFLPLAMLCWMASLSDREEIEDGRSN